MQKQREPEFHDDSTHLLHEGGIKASIKWEENEGEYVVLWYQDPFYNHGGFSMSEPLWDEVVNYDHIDKVYVDSENEGRLFLFDKEELEDGKVLPPSHPDTIGKYHQHVVKMGDAKTTWNR